MMANKSCLTHLAERVADDMTLRGERSNSRDGMVGGPHYIDGCNPLGVLISMSGRPRRWTSFEVSCLDMDRVSGRLWGGDRRRVPWSVKPQIPLRLDPVTRVSMKECEARGGCIRRSSSRDHGTSRSEGNQTSEVLPVYARRYASSVRAVARGGGVRRASR